MRNCSASRSSASWLIAAASLASSAALRLSGRTVEDIRADLPRAARGSFGRSGAPGNLSLRSHRRGGLLAREAAEQAISAASGVDRVLAPISPQFVAALAAFGTAVQLEDEIRISGGLLGRHDRHIHLRVL